MKPREGERVVNTRGSIIGYVKGPYTAAQRGPWFVVPVGRRCYRLLEWDRSWAAWVAYGRQL